MKKNISVLLTLVLVALFCGTVFAAEVTGKVESGASGTSIKATSVKGDDGAAIASLAGKSLKVVGAKVADVAKMAGKDVIAKGTLKSNNTEIEVTSVAPAATTSAPASNPPAK